MRFKTKPVFIVILSGLIAGLAPAFGADNEPSKHADLSDAFKSSPLHEAMEEMSDHYKILGRGLRNAGPENAPELLNAVNALQVLAVKCKEMEPTKTLEIPKGERTAFNLAYRLAMIESVELMLKIEAALLKGEYDNAVELFDALKDARKDGHGEFMWDEEKD